MSLNEMQDRNRAFITSTDSSCSTERTVCVPETRVLRYIRSRGVKLSIFIALAMTSLEQMKSQSLAIARSFS